MNEKFTAWCGLCCVDCIPSNKDLFDLVHKLEETLSYLQFDEYAKLKAEKNPVFEEYPVFIKVLKEIESLKCSIPCREGGGKPVCEIRNCVQGKGYLGCWECSDRCSCTKLDFLRSVHPNLDYHLDLIGKYGPESWLSKRGVHYRWQKVLKKQNHRTKPIVIIGSVHSSLVKDLLPSPTWSGLGMMERLSRLKKWVRSEKNILIFRSKF